MGVDPSGWLFWLTHHLHWVKQHHSLLLEQRLEVEVWSFIVTFRLLNQIWMLVRSLSGFSSIHLVYAQSSVSSSILQDCNDEHSAQAFTAKFCQMEADNILEGHQKLTCHHRNRNHNQIQRDGYKIIKQAIITSTKYSFKQLIKDQMILWWHKPIVRWQTLVNREDSTSLNPRNWPKHDQQFHFRNFLLIL